MAVTQDARVSVAQKTFVGGPGYENKSYIDPVVFQEGLKRKIDQDMDKFSVEQALDAHDAYYKDERKYFVGVITKQIIERHLVSPLAKTLSPTIIAHYDDKDIHFVAAEPPEAIQMREHLTSKKKMLEDGQSAFRVATGQYI